jgi:hypothetical protein
MRKIALIGTAGSAPEAPYHDPSWEIWGVSARGEYVTRADRWFELHRLDGEPPDWAANWRKTIKTFTHDLDLYMFYPEPDLGPNIKNYPHDHIVSRFGTYFMTSSFAWMMAMAIDELRPQKGKPVDGEIGVWGVDMEYGTEYTEQRSGFRHFFELAKILGIKVSRLASSGLAYEPVPYPLWQDDPLLNKLKLRQSDSRHNIDSLNDSLRRTHSLISNIQGALNEINKASQKGYSRKKSKEGLQKQLDGLMDTSGSLSKELVHWQATSEEQSWLRDYLIP